MLSLPLKDGFKLSSPSLYLISRLLHLELVSTADFRFESLWIGILRGFFFFRGKVPFQDLFVDMTDVYYSGVIFPPLGRGRRRKPGRWRREAPSLALTWKFYFCWRSLDGLGLGFVHGLLRPTCIHIHSLQPYKLCCVDIPSQSFSRVFSWQLFVPYMCYIFGSIFWPQY